MSSDGLSRQAQDRFFYEIRQMKFSKIFGIFLYYSQVTRSMSDPSSDQ